MFLLSFHFINIIISLPQVIISGMDHESPVYTIQLVVKPVVQHGLTTGCIVYTNIQPVVKPVVQPVVSCKRGLRMPSVTQSKQPPEQLLMSNADCFSYSHADCGTKHHLMSQATKFLFHFIFSAPAATLGQISSKFRSKI